MRMYIWPNLDNHLGSAARGLRKCFYGGQTYDGPISAYWGSCSAHLTFARRASKASTCRWVNEAYSPRVRFG